MSFFIHLSSIFFYSPAVQNAVHLKNSHTQKSDLGQHFFEKEDKFYDHISVAVFFLYCVITSIAIFFHEAWRDEWQAVQLANHLKDFNDLYMITRAEGHPPLWFLIIKVTWFLFPDFNAIKIIHLLLSYTVAFLILFKIDFDRLSKYMLLFGYFFIFEYTVIARNYNMTIIAALLLVVMIRKGNNVSVIRACFCLFIMVLSNAYGYILAVSFLVYFILESFVYEKRYFRKHLTIYLMIWISLTLTTIFFLKNNHSSELNIHPVQLKNLKNSVGAIYNAFLPTAIVQNPVLNLFDRFYEIQKILPLQIQQFLISHHKSLNSTLKFVLLLPLLCSLLYGFKRYPVALASLLVAWLGIYLLQTFVYFGSLRHHGFYFISFVLFLLAAPTYQSGFILKVLLGIHLLAGMYIVFVEIKYPFSNIREMCQIIDSEPKKLPLVVNDYPFNSSFAGLLGRQVYSPNNVQPEHYTDWQSWDKKSYSILNTYRQLKTVCADLGVTSGYLYIHHPVKRELNEFKNQMISSTTKYYWFPEAIIDETGLLIRIDFTQP